MGRPGTRLLASFYFTHISFFVFLKKTPLLGSGRRIFLISGTEYPTSGKLYMSALGPVLSYRSGSTGRLTFVRDFNVQTARMELAFAATWAIDTLLYCVQKPNDEHGDPVRSSGAAELLREFTR